jgi:hypothetical protein
VGDRKRVATAGGDEWRLRAVVTSEVRTMNVVNETSPSDSRQLAAIGFAGLNIETVAAGDPAALPLLAARSRERSDSA